MQPSFDLLSICHLSARSNMNRTQAGGVLHYSTDRVKMLASETIRSRRSDSHSGHPVCIQCTNALYNDSFWSFRLSRAVWACAISARAVSVWLNEGLSLNQSYSCSAMFLHLFSRLIRLSDSPSLTSGEVVQVRFAL